MRFWKIHVLIGALLSVGACSTMPPPPVRPITRPVASNPVTPRPQIKRRTRLVAPKVMPSVNAIHVLADNTQYLQTDSRWARQTLGGSGESLEGYGCLVTAAAMALNNLGFRTDPGDLVNRLKANGGFTKNGLLVWSSLEKITGDRAETLFYRRKDDEVVRRCLAAGYYPLVKFDLPSRRTHWAMVVMETDRGFYVRDPMVASSIPIPLTSRARGIDAVRCVGVPA